MKAGDIVFVRGNSLISKMVRLFDKGEFSHVAIAVSDTEVLEANWNIKTRITDFYFKDYEILDLGLTNEERKLIKEASPYLVGRYYDFPQITWYMIGKLFSFDAKNRFNSPNNLICSEVIFYLLSEIGWLDEALDIDPDVTPNELYAILKSIKKSE